MLQVRSEIGRLRRVLLHEPGPEIDGMVPAMMEQLLFDDILHGARAREEHRLFRRVLQLLGVEVLDAADLLAQTLQETVARRFIVEVVLQDLPASLRARLETLAGDELATILVAGARREVSWGVEADQLYDIPPLPNWCFQRDPQIILGGGVIFCAMATAARHREALLARAIFRFHPRFRSTPVWFDPLEASREQLLFVGAERPHLEGGDVLLFSPDLIAVGLSARTNAAGARQLARALARRPDGPRFILLVELPHRRAYMHLDTLITPVDRDACLIHAPVLLPGGPETAPVWEIDLHSADLAFEPRRTLLDSLTQRGVELEPIPCGGQDPVSQQREQWTDGANALALAPGVIILFDRNTATAEELSRRGFRIVQAEALILGRDELDLDAPGRVCILIPSQEISRARGGPHCLAHPLLRQS